MKKTAVNLAVITSLMFSPLSAQCDCGMVDPCFAAPPFVEPPRESWMQRNGFPVVGGLLLGAAAGALAGYGVSNSNKNTITTCCGDKGGRLRRGKCGRDGRDGRDFRLRRDRDHTNITVFYNLELGYADFADGNAVNVTVFVTLPDHTTIEGSKMRYDFTTTQLTLTNLPNISVNRPFFGNYSIGVRLENAGTPLIDFSNMSVELYSTVNANREGGSVTSLHSLTPPVGISVSANTSQLQTAVDFTYDDPLVWATIP